MRIRRRQGRTWYPFEVEVAGQGAEPCGSSMTNDGVREMTARHRGTQRLFRYHGRRPGRFPNAFAIPFALIAKQEYAPSGKHQFLVGIVESHSRVVDVDSVLLQSQYA